MNMDAIEVINGKTFELATLLWPWFMATVTLVGVLMFKDFITKVAKGLEFRLHPAFAEGDKVILEGERAVIIKVGWMLTTFGMIREEGVIWRFVYNERIPYLKLEKVISETRDVRDYGNKEERPS